MVKESEGKIEHGAFSSALQILEHSLNNFKYNYISLQFFTDELNIPLIFTEFRKIGLFRLGYASIIFRLGVACR